MIQMIIRDYLKPKTTNLLYWGLLGVKYKDLQHRNILVN